MIRIWRNAVIGLIAIAACAASAHANTILFATGPMMLSGKPVNAEASFKIDPVADTIEISILNLQDNPISIAQLISGLSFTLSHFSNASPDATIVNERATEIEVDGMGRIVEVETTLDTDWKVIPVAGATFDLCTVCNGSGDPDQLLIGGPAPDGKYTSANGSIAGNGPHNPFLLASSDSTPYWVVRLYGLGPATDVSGATFRFGTAYGALTAPGAPTTATPEPGTIVLIACGFVLLAIGRWRNRKGRTA